MAAVVNINDVLDGHIALDLDRLDRLYLNAYIPNLQVGGQVVTFLTQHLGNEVPSPALFKRIGDRFRQGQGYPRQGGQLRLRQGRPGGDRLLLLRP